MGNSSLPFHYQFSFGKIINGEPPKTGKNFRGIYKGNRLLWPKSNNFFLGIAHTR